jgi:uncharacterized membrane protein YczE
MIGSVYRVENARAFKLSVRIRSVGLAGRSGVFSGEETKRTYSTRRAQAIAFGTVTFVLMAGWIINVFARITEAFVENVSVI